MRQSAGGLAGAAFCRSFLMLLPAANLPRPSQRLSEAQGSNWKPGLRTLLLPHCVLQQALVPRDGEVYAKDLGAGRGQDRGTVVRSVPEARDMSLLVKVK